MGNNIILIGYRGTGKSSVAELVAASTNRTVFHMDDEITERAGCSIREFVTERGWDAFRDLEAQVAREASALSDTVIDTGGGVVGREDNMACLTASGTVVWLRAAADTIRERIASETGRPSLTGDKSALDEIEDMLQEREPMYEKYASSEVPTDGRTLGEIANDIITIDCGA
jgi:shikimate kinase